MLINHIFWKTKTIDYSAKLATVKAEMGPIYKLHPDHDPLEYPWQYEPWQIGRMLVERMALVTQPPQPQVG